MCINKGRLLALTISIGLGCKGLPGINTIAYLPRATAIKKFFYFITDTMTNQVRIIVLGKPPW
jgi:hypothetical protein